MSEDLMIPRKPTPIVYKTKRYKLSESLLDALDAYKTAHGEIRPDEEITEDELVQFLLESAIERDKAFKAWQKRQAA